MAQSRKDREDESRGMKKRLRKGEGKSESYSFVEGNDPMVGRDSRAGLPSEVMMRDYPRASVGRGGSLDDSMRGIDECNRDSEREVYSNLSDQH